jgi:hypothetical protein
LLYRAVKGLMICACTALTHSWHTTNKQISFFIGSG